MRRDRSRPITESDAQEKTDLFEFPYAERAFVYVDLRRDIFITSHRRLGRRRQTKTIPEPAKFSNFPVSCDSSFKIAIFRTCIPRQVFDQIHIFVATFALGIHELFPGRYGMGMGTNKPVLVFRDAFLREGEGEDHDEKAFGKYCGRDFINTFKGSLRGISDERREKLGERIVGPIGRKEFDDVFERGEFSEKYWADISDGLKIMADKELEREEEDDDE